MRPPADGAPASTAGGATSTVSETEADAAAVAKAADVRLGLICAIAAYTLWGAFPIFLKQIDHVGAMEIVAQRILWSVPFCAIILTFRKQWREVRTAFKWRTLRLLLLSAAIISLNWFFYVWAVADNRVLEASLGYYINPLMFVAAGVIVLREKLTRPQWIAIAMASIGVLILTFGAGVFPWVAFLLAISFTAYGFVRKKIEVGALPSLFVETAALAPLAAALVFYLAATTGLSFGSGDLTLDFLLMLSGPVTVIPLTLFALGARRLQLSTIGFLQYIGPTGQFILGIYYGEAFTLAHAICFGLIWTGLAILSVDAWRHSRKPKKPIAKAETVGSEA